MTVSRRQMLAAGAAAVPASAVYLSAAAGQQGTRPGGAAQPPAQPGAAGQMQAGPDPMLAACVLIGGRRQIETCQFALTKLQTDEAKQFAKAEIDEHEGIKAKLKGLGLEYPSPTPGSGGATDRGTGTAGDRGAGGAGAAGGGTGTAGGGAQTGGAQPGGAQPGRAGAAIPAQVTVGRTPLPAGAAQLVYVDAEVAEQCIQNYKAKMSKKEGLKFDKAFIGDQLHEHMGLLDKVQTYRRHASQQMEPVLAEGQKVIEAHIAKLEQLMPQIEKQYMEKEGRG